ncbi:MAG: hypothetical protein HC896_08775 [Bacteroidales bacterium]|nr:hypothetical protein [Bacteroidales bacterium]
MNLLNSESHSPYYNLATEEYLLKHTREEWLFLYRNQPSLIVGKHQNPYIEVNFPFVYANHVPIARRISGEARFITIWATLTSRLCLTEKGRHGKL